MSTRPFTFFAAALLALGVAGCAPADVSSDGAATVRVVLDESVAAPVAAQLRGPIPFQDRMGTALVTQLDEPLDVDGEKVDSYRAGDVAYSAADREVVVFLSDGSAVPAGGLTRLGEIADGLDGLMGCVSDCPLVFNGVGAEADESTPSALPAAR